MSIMRTYEELEQRIAFLEESLREKDAILDLLPDHLVIQDLDHRILWANQAACVSLGLDRSEILNRKCHELWANQEVPCRDCPMPETSKQGGHLEIRKTTPDGRSWRIRCCPLQSRHGHKHTKVLEITEDISESVKNRTEQRLILDTMQEMLAYQDTDLRVKWANKAAAESTGKEPEDLVGEHCYEIWQMRDAPCEGCPVLKAIKTGEAQESEAETPDGRVYKIRGYPVFDEKNHIIGAVEYGLDITEGKKAEIALIESESLLNHSQKVANVGSFVWDLRNDSLYWSKNMYAIHGLDEETFSGNLSDVSAQLIHPDDRNRIEMEIQKMIKEKSVRSMEFRIIRPDGQKRIMQSNGEFEVNESGKPIKCFGIHQDITERKLMESALRESEEKFRLLFENSADAHVLYAGDRYVDCNRACLNMLGFTRKSQFLSMHPADISPPFQKDGKSSREKAESMIALAFEKGSYRFEWVCQRTDGSELILDVLLNGIKIKGEDIIHGVWRDITDQKRAETALRESERKYRDLVDTLPYGIEEIDLNGRSVFLNDAYHHMLGYKPGELVGTYLWDHDPTEGSANKVKAYFDFIKNEKPKPEPYISKNLRKDGTIIDVNVDWNYKFDESGELKGFIAVVTDITDKIQSERALKESEFRFRSFVENANDIVYAVSPEGLFTYVSPNWLEFMGEPADDAIGKSFIPYVHPDDVHLCQQFLDKVLTSGQKQSSVEYRAKHKDGSLRWQVSNGSPMRGMDGNITGYVGIARDVTEKKQIENELRESEEKFSKAFQSAPLLMTITSIDDGRFVDVNDAFVSLTGYSREAAIGSRSTEIGFALLDERNRMLDILKTEGRVKDLELTVNRADGSQMVCLYSAEIFNLKGQKCLLSTAIDISGRKQAEDALKESEKRFRTLIEAGPLSILLLREGKYIYGNPASARMLGYKDPDEIIGVSALETIAPEYHNIIHERIQNINQGKANKPVEVGLIKPNGEIAWSLSTSVSVIMEGKPTAIIMGQDITALKKAQKDLSKAQTLQVALAEHLPAGMMLVDASTRRIESINVYAASLFGAGIDEIIGHKCHKFICPASEGECPICDLGQKIDNAEREIVLKNGSRLPIIKSVVSITIDEKEKLLEYFIDISDRKKVENELRESEEKYRKLVTTAPYGIQVTDRDGKIIFSNPAHHKIQGYDNGELFGKYIWELLADEDLRSQAKSYYQKILNEQPKPEVYYNRILTRDSRDIDVQVNWDYLRNSKGEIEGIISIISDITKQKALESSIQQAQKMESIGNLAGGIAHDFNNILFPIIGLSEMLLEDLPPGSGERENAEEIFIAGKRGRDLVRQILAFSRQSDHKMVPTRVQHILKEVLKLSRSTIPTYIDIQQQIQPDCGVIMADPTQIHQVAMNIITNAYHAMEDEGGKLTVQLKQVELLDSDFAEKFLEPGKYALLSISDTGHGISNELINKIFEPYFTTKAQGKGTGLGLAVVYGIVQEHKGNIKVHSEIGKGSTFDVYLPLLDKPDRAESVKRVEDCFGGTERILVVDDEYSIAKLEKQMLERLGYQVTTRVDSLEALKVFKAGPNAFDMVISDMTMPNMTGDQLAREMIAIRPDIPIIICTGFSERLNQEKTASIGAKGFLMKPIVKSDMAKTVRRVLDEAKSENQK